VIAIGECADENPEEMEEEDEERHVGVVLGGGEWEQGHWD